MHLSISTSRQGSGLVGLLLLTLLAPRGGLALDVVPPETVDLSSGGLRAVTELLESEVRRGALAGAVGLVARGGKVAYLEAVGYRDLESRDPLRTDSLFRIASMTKAITSVAILSLAEEGVLSLDDPVSRFLPGFDRPTVVIGVEGDELRTAPAHRHVTIRDLLTHTSGITYGHSGHAPLDRLYSENVPSTFVPRDESLADQVTRIGKLPLKFQPGSAWDYGLSTDVLGRVVEVASGLRLDLFFRERIFRPLGMRDTFFRVPDEKVSRLSSLYSPGEDGRLEKVGQEPLTRAGLTFTEDFCLEGGDDFHSGGGGLVSSTGDYFRFLQMLLNRGQLDGVRILEESTVRAMTTDQTGDLEVPAWGHGDGFGLGFGVLTPSGKKGDVASVGTFSWGGIFNTYYWVDPAEDLVGIFMSQVYPFGHLQTRSRFKEAVYRALDDTGFIEEHWYEPEEEFNPHFNSRQLRVNGPLVTLHPVFSKRSEPRSSGLARIELEHLLLDVHSVKLYCEIWGGHPGTMNKRVGINGKSLYHIPQVGTEEGFLTHQYPEIRLPRTDLVRGYNSLQFTCDNEDTFWAHYIVDNAALRVRLPRQNERVSGKGLDNFEATVIARLDPVRQVVTLELSVPSGLGKHIARVHYQGRYLGYDENGNGETFDWHGMTKARQPLDWIGETREAPFRLEWDTSLLPAQEGVQVRARIEFHDLEGLHYRTSPTAGFALSPREGTQVRIVHTTDFPDHFWSRAGKKKVATIDLPLDPARIRRAELRLISWTGGPGEVKEYFTLNGTFFPVADGHDHQVHSHRMPVDPSILRRGANRIELLSDTLHHGIEILKPGPALILLLEDA